MDERITTFNDFLNNRIKNILDEMTTAQRNEDPYSLAFNNGGLMENERVKNEFNRLFKERDSERKSTYER